MWGVIFHIPYYTFMSNDERLGTFKHTHANTVFAWAEYAQVNIRVNIQKTEMTVNETDSFAVRIFLQESLQQDTNASMKTELPLSLFSDTGKYNIILFASNTWIPTDAEFTPT